MEFATEFQSETRLFAFPFVLMPLKSYGSIWPPLPQLYANIKADWAF